ncbi:MAG: hypothetical protein K1W39_12365 [Lachnospiraceae bacterium]
MKYDKELYLDSGIYGLDEEVTNKKEKIVLCRMPHICASCAREIRKGEQALYESGFLDGEPVSCYTCLECIEEWLEETGQAVNEDE